MAIDYRHLTTTETFEQVTDLEILIWQVDPRHAVTFHTLHIIVHTGGCVIGAWDGAQLVGFVIGFAMHDTDRLWSHIAAVHPDYQGRGIGAALKHRQRDWAREQGYRVIHWTYDPLMRANANFNFRHLGVTVTTYHENFYGMMNDGLNAGLPTDRFQVTWTTDAPADAPAPPADAPFLLTLDADQHPHVATVPTADWHFVAIPRDIAALKRSQPPIAQNWRMTLRRVVQDALAQGYQVVDFVERSGLDAYALYRPPVDQ